MSGGIGDKNERQECRSVLLLFIYRDENNLKCANCQILICSEQLDFAGHICKSFLRGGKQQIQFFSKTPGKWHDLFALRDTTGKPGKIIAYLNK